MRPTADVPVRIGPAVVAVPVERTSVAAVVHVAAPVGDPLTVAPHIPMLWAYR